VAAGGRSLGERLNTIQIAGSLLILAGVIFLRIYEGRRLERTRSDAVQTRLMEEEVI
jgi:drug/metabolite transporter (DMT)-like permease